MPPRRNTIAADEAFIVTVGVPHRHRDTHCSRALRVLQQAGYAAGPTSDESILELATQVRLVQALKENDPE
jgi:GTP cyclohydrolase FolE2